MYQMFHKREDGHDDSIWSVAWARSEKDNSENIVTGGVDDLVKSWNWRFVSSHNCFLLFSWMNLPEFNLLNESYFYSQSSSQ
jgi:hypothetical protein